MRKTEYTSRPAGPFFGLWSMWYLDPVVTIKRELSGRRKVRHKAFAERLLAGDPMPPVRLRTPAGEEVDLARHHGKKNVVVEFGAIT